MENYDYAPEDRRFLENEVHTILYISGTEEGKENAKKWLEETGKRGLDAGEGFEYHFKKLIFKDDGENIWTQIDIDNTIPQVYESLVKLPGLAKIIWATFADSFTNLLTNDVNGVILKRMETFGIPSGLEPDVYDPVVEDDYYPDIHELAAFRSNLPI